MLHCCTSVAPCQVKTAPYTPTNKFGGSTAQLVVLVVVLACVAVVAQVGPLGVGCIGLIGLTASRKITKPIGNSKPEPEAVQIETQEEFTKRWREERIRANRIERLQSLARAWVGSLICLSIFLGVLFLLVQFVKWAWVSA